MRSCKALLPLTLWMASISACSRTPQVPAQDPILAYGHGTFIGVDGKPVTPDRDFIISAQRYYVASLERQAQGRETLAIERARRFVAGLVNDEIIANSIYIDWLIENVRPDDAAKLDSINGALRWHYLDNIDTRKPGLDIKRRKGVASDIAEKLEAGGIKVLYKTTAGGGEYIRECAAAGVPVPPPVFSAGWTNRGAISNPFLSAGARAEVMHFTSTTPPGVCLALPRYKSTGGGNFSNKAFLFGLICLGTVSNKACFWDNPRGTEFERGVPVDISEFVGGVDLVANNQGVCSDCHAGENPYVVHPDNPPFSGLTASILPGGWYDPLVHGSWPQNPGPTNLLDAVSSVGRCDSCHRVGVAGRFPDASTQLPQWCSVVLSTAVGGVPPGTMPPNGLNKSQFTNHMNALKAACDTAGGGGVIVDVNYADNTSLISPPIVIDPLYGCATKVAVRSAIYNAKVTVSINGSPLPSRMAKNPFFEEFSTPALNVNDVVTAKQEFNGVTSADSPAITVRDHRVDYPNGLPAPEVDPGLIYECAEIVAVRNVPGATITLFTNNGFPVSGVASTDWTGLFGGKRPFVAGDSFTAEQALCADTSPRSGAKSAVAAPSSMPAPTFNPPITYAGQQLVTLETLVNGSHTSVRELTFGPLGNVTTPVSWFPNFDVATPLGRPLNGGDRLEAVQTLCSKGPPGVTPPPTRCDSLPAPKIAHPIVGNNYVVVIDAVPGARIRVYDAANIEIGDGSGTVIILTRALTGADTITVVQQIGECTSKTGYRVSARNPGSNKG
jgi:hypothetical protein